MCGATCERVAVDLEGAQVARVYPDHAGPRVGRPLTSSTVWHSTTGVKPSDCARSTSETSASWSSAATTSSARSAPCARASQSW